MLPYPSSGGRGLRHGLGEMSEQSVWPVREKPVPQPDGPTRSLPCPPQEDPISSSHSQHPMSSSQHFPRQISVRGHARNTGESAVSARGRRCASIRRYREYAPSYLPIGRRTSIPVETLGQMVSMTAVGQGDRVCFAKRPASSDSARLLPDRQMDETRDELGLVEVRRPFLVSADPAHPPVHFEQFARGQTDALRASFGHHDVHPPSTVSVEPVTYEAASLTRKTAAPVSSTGLPTRPRGIDDVIRSFHRLSSRPELRSVWK